VPSLHHLCDPATIAAHTPLTLLTLDDGPQLLRELAPAQHPNIVSLEDIFLSPQDKSLYMVFEFADYNLFVRALGPMSHRRAWCCVCVCVRVWLVARGVCSVVLTCTMVMAGHYSVPPGPKIEPGPVHSQEHHVADAQRHPLPPRQLDHAQRHQAL
jgi:hypothetical protein